MSDTERPSSSPPASRGGRRRHRLLGVVAALLAGLGGTAMTASAAAAQERGLSSPGTVSVWFGNNTPADYYGARDNAFPGIPYADLGNGHNGFNLAGGQYFFLPDVELGVNEFRLGFDYKANDPDAQGILVSTVNSCVTAFSGFQLSMDPDGNLSMQTGIQGGAVQLFSGVPTNLNDGNVHEVQIRRQPAVNLLRIYVDGVEVFRGNSDGSGGSVSYDTEEHLIGIGENPGYPEGCAGSGVTPDAVIGDVFVGPQIYEGVDLAPEDLSIRQGSTDPIPQGGDGTIPVVVSNTGPSSASANVVIEAPRSTTFTDAPTGPAGSTCRLESSTRASCTNVTVGPGGSVTLSTPVRVSEGAPAGSTQTASNPSSALLNSTTHVDTNYSNDFTTLAVQVAPLAAVPLVDPWVGAITVTAAVAMLGGWTLVRRRRPAPLGS